MNGHWWFGQVTAAPGSSGSWPTMSRRKNGSSREPQASSKGQVNPDINPASAFFVV